MIKKNFKIKKKKLGTKLKKNYKKILRDTPFKKQLIN